MLVSSRNNRKYCDFWLRYPWGCLCWSVSSRISWIKLPEKAKQNLPAFEPATQEVRPQYPCVHPRLGTEARARTRARARGGGHPRREFASADEPAGQPASSRQFEPEVRLAPRR